MLVDLRSFAILCSYSYLVNQHAFQCLFSKKHTYIEPARLTDYLTDR